MKAPEGVLPRTILESPTPRVRAHSPSHSSLFRMGAELVIVGARGFMELSVSQDTESLLASVRYESIAGAAGAGATTLMLVE